MSKKSVSLAVEAPLALLGRLDAVTDFEFIIAPVCKKYPNYLAHFKAVRERTKRKVILDNGAFEGELCSIHEMIDLAKDLCPHEVVIPDIVGSAEGTLRCFEEFLEEWRWPSSLKVKEPELQVVPQGESVDEWLDCYAAMVTAGREVVSAVGISYISGLHWGEREEHLCQHYFNLPRLDAIRLYLCSQLVTQGIYDPTKRHHLLGLTTIRTIFAFHELFPNMISSVDTSLPVALALVGEVLDHHSIKPKQKIDYELACDEKVEGLALHNCRNLQSVCRGTYFVPEVEAGTPLGVVK